MSEAGGRPPRRKRRRKSATRRTSAMQRMRDLRKRDPNRRRQQLRMLLAGFTLLTITVLVWVAFALSSAGQGSRMAAFADAPTPVRDDLLYLTYIDSLARDQRAVPAMLSADLPDAPDQMTGILLPQLLASAAGVRAATMRQWGLQPRSEDDHGPLNELFRELNRRGRIILPLYNEALWTHLRERRLHPGYIVFGQTTSAGANEADFCAVLTAANSIQPDYSAFIYRDPDSGQYVHGDFGHMPQFAYLGGGRLGDDIPAVYREYFQMRDARNRKPLYAE